MPTGPGGVWLPDSNPLLSYAQTISAIQNNQLFPLRQQQMQLENTGLGIANQSRQTELQNTYANNLRVVASSVPPPPAGASADVVAQYNANVYRAVQRGAGTLYPQDMANSWFGGANVQGAPDIRELARESAIASGSQTAMTAQFGNPDTRNSGGNIQSVDVNPVTGQVTKMGGDASNVTLQQSPETMGGYIPIKRADGSVVSVPRSTVETADAKGIPNVQGPDGQALTGPHGEILGSLPAGQEGALASNVQNQQDRANALQTAFEGSAQRKALLQELLSTNGEFRSGPGAAKWSEMVTEFNRAFGTHFENDPASSQQVFGKIAQMIAAQQRDTLGLPATNAGEAAAQVASPNSAYSTEANQTLIGQLIGNEDLLQKKQSAWTKYQKAGGTYNGFVNQFNTTFDPRFFWDQYLPDTHKAERGMNDAQVKQYEARKARAMGLNY